MCLSRLMARGRKQTSGRTLCFHSAIKHQQQCENSFNIKSTFAHDRKIQTTIYFHTPTHPFSLPSNIPVLIVRTRINEEYVTIKKRTSATLHAPTLYEGQTKDILHKVCFLSLSIRDDGLAHICAGLVRLLRLTPILSFR